MTKLVGILYLLIAGYACLGSFATSPEEASDDEAAAVTAFPPLPASSSSKAYSAWFGIMLVQQRNSMEEQHTNKVCTSFYPEISNMPVNETSAVYHPVLDAFDWWPCSPTPPPGSLAGHLLLLNGSRDPSNCSLLEAASAVQALGAAGSIFVRSKQPPTQTTHNTSLWFSFIGNSTYQLIISDNTTKVAVYSPPEDFSMNYSLIIIWVLAVGTVAVGAYWSGRVRHSLYKEGSHVSVPRRRRRSSDGAESTVDAADSKQKDEVFINTRVMIFMVIMMCLMLVALYYLYEYLVYVIIGLFCVASVSAVYSCLEPLLLRVPCATCRTPYFNVYVLRGQVEVRQVLLLFFSLGLVITWLVLRNEPYAWILQDVLGVAFCINMLRLIKLHDLRICTVLLSCLFFYDIFFVFITPLFTSDGNSIMVEVAKGSGEGGEQLPMVFKVPHFVYSEVVSVCQLSGNYNLLGFGDVLVPGLLIAFLYSYDLRTRGPKCPLYFTVNVIAYGVGLCLTFLGLYMMQGAQPALLYLVPCTLLTTVVIAAVRGDLASMWRGDGPHDESLAKIQDNEEEEATHGAHDGIAGSALASPGVP
ncbi:Peptidase A22B signal peptide peptidase [Trinorchestia longiramus]|nr:Peptidase A22B signal peptide peptidase [Trinorchestia longiramus]